MIDMGQNPRGWGETRNDGCVIHSERSPLDAWDHWVGELEQRPLDRATYELLLQARADLNDALEISGREQDWKSADRIDHRFHVLTQRVADSPYSAPDREGWWWNRLPSAKKYRAYLDES